MFFMGAYLVSLFLPFVAVFYGSTGAYSRSLLACSLLVLLIAGHTLHRSLVQRVSSKSPQDGANDLSKRTDGVGH